MRLSEERISGLSRRIMDLLLDEEHLDLEIGEDRFGVMLEAKLTQLLRIEDEIDEEASSLDAPAQARARGRHARVRGRDGEGQEEHRRHARATSSIDGRRPPSLPVTPGRDAACG